MLRAALLGLCLVALPACTTTSTIYPHPSPDRLERPSARLKEPLLAVVHFGDHASHTLGVVAGPEVSSVSFVATDDGDLFGPSSDAARRWNVVARDLVGREEVVAAIAAYEVRGSDPLPGIPRGPELWIGTPGASGKGSTALAISLDGHFNGVADQRANAASSLFEALLALERAQTWAEEARQRRD